jgi:predicted dehydrogenase
MAKKIKIGLIGAGMIGDVHIDRIRRDGRGEVSWIASRTRETLKHKLEKFGIPNGSTDYGDMLGDPDVEAVIIASPPHTHREMLENALNAGKHVLLEKPMAVNRDEIETMIKLAREHPAQIVLECSCRHARLQPKFGFIKNLIDTGSIGEVYHIHHNSLTRGIFIEYNPAGVWAHEKSLAGGGPFIDWGVYDLSFHLGLLGDNPALRSVRSFTRKGLKSFGSPGFQSDIEEHGAAWLEFSGGLTYYYERGAGVQAEIPNETRIFGTKGVLSFAFCSWDKSEINHYYIEDHKEKHRVLRAEMPPDHDDHMELIRHFLDVLTQEAKPEMTVDLAAKHLDILFRILGS